MAFSIAYLRRSDVQTEKWDACIDNAPNGLIYAYTGYLDAMTDDWDALVLDDYAAVMPLPSRKKWGLSYLYHPFLTAQLGVFGRCISQELLVAFLNAVPKKFILWDFSLNHGNRFTATGFPLYERSNYVLPLSTDYETLQKNYRENIRRNVRKCVGYGCRMTADVPLRDVIAIAKQQALNSHEGDFKNFADLYAKLHQDGKAKTYGVYSKTNELLASAAFLFSHNRAYYLLVGNHPNGRTLGASHALIDAFIRDHANTDLLLDFEGSDLRNLAFFYSSFGAREEKYAAIKLERLPWWVRVLRR